MKGETEVLGEKNYTPPTASEWIIMEQWWNNTKRE
jgi:hypothetical protein